MSVPYAHVFSYMHTILDEGNSCVVKMYCLRPEGGTSIVTMREFKPFFYMEVPKEYTVSGNKKTKLTDYMNQAKELKTCRCDGKCLCPRVRMVPKWEWVYRRRLYFAHKEKTDTGYRNVKSLFIKVQFDSLRLMEVYKQMCRWAIKLDGYAPFRMKIHESEQQLLKFFACTGLPSIGWVDILVPQVDASDKITLHEANIHEYVCSYKSVKASPDDLILLPKVMTFDIEAYSHIHTAFPNVGDIRDEVFQISVILTEQKKTRKLLLSLGKPAPIEDVTIITFASEPQLLVGFMNLITTERPNVVLGYNSFGFDLRYILRRATPFPDYLKKRNPDDKQIEEYKRVPVHSLTSKMYNVNPFSSSSKKCKEMNEVWSSGAFGKQDMTILDIDGVIMIDLYVIIKREFKLISYKLDSVAEFFLGSHKDPLTPKDIFRCFEKNTPESMALVGKYCVQDAYLTFLLFEKLQVWLGQCEMAKTTKVPMMWLSTKGQQIKIYSQILHYGWEHDVLVETDVVSYEDITYKGATVYAPEPGIYHNVMAFDFASLYPSIIISHNIDYTSLVQDRCQWGQDVCTCTPRCQDPSIPDSDCHVFTWSDHENCEHDPINGKSHRKSDKTYCGDFHYRFLKHEVSEKGIIPTIISDQLDARKKTRKEIAVLKKKVEEEKLDEEEVKMIHLRLDVLEERQKSYKINANSMYGVLGARKGYLPLLPAAMCVTYIGRQSIKKASTFITNHYQGTILYGDTDSCFCTFPEMSLMDLHTMAQDISKATQAIFPAPMKLEYEGKIYKDFFILCKKRYLARSCDEYGVMSSKMLKKGVQTQRRDSTKLLKKMFDESVLHIMNGESFDTVMLKIIDDIKTMFTLGFEDKYFLISKSLAKDDYKSKPPQVVLKEKMERRGKQVPTGTRIDYVITTNGGPLAKQAVKVEEDAFYRAYRSIVKLDFLYYLDHQLANPLNEIIEKAYKKKDMITLIYKERLAYYKVIQHLNTIFSPRITFEDEVVQEKKKIVREIRRKIIEED